jgi:hypothetical protein
MLPLPTLRVFFALQRGPIEFGLSTEDRRNGTRNLWRGAAGEGGANRLLLKQIIVLIGLKLALLLPVAIVSCRS